MKDSDMAIGWTTVGRARVDLADLLDDLTNEQLATPSLSEGMTVLEVGGLFASLCELTPMKLIIGVAKNRGDEDAFLVEKAKEHAAMGVDSISGILRRNPERKAKGVTEASMVTLAACQTLNISMSLGLERALDPEVLMMALDHSALELAERLGDSAPRLEATDSDWVSGDGLLVRGTSEALLLALNDLVLEDELVGNGVSLLS